MLLHLSGSERRVRRVRLKLRESCSFRLSVFRSNRHFYAQLIDDGEGRTLAAASTLEPEVLSVAQRRVNAASVKMVAKLLAGRIDKLGAQHQRFVFDRGRYKYMGVVAVFADELRGLGFRF